MKHKNLVGENSLHILESCAGGVSDLVKRQVAKNSGGPLPAQYSPALKSFAVTLNFCNARTRCSKDPAEQRTNEGPYWSNERPGESI